MSAAVDGVIKIKVRSVVSLLVDPVGEGTLGAGVVIVIVVLSAVPFVGLLDVGAVTAIVVFTGVGGAVPAWRPARPCGSATRAALTRRPSWKSPELGRAMVKATKASPVSQHKGMAAN